MSVRILVIIFFLITSNAFAADIYVDADCTGNPETDYHPGNDACSGGTDTVYSTVQLAVTNVTVGDTIHVRSGTYSENVDIPEAKNGTAWTAGNFTTIQSYVGEWAIVSCTTECFAHPSMSGSSKAPIDYPTRYWKFERLELTGGRFGMLFEQGPIWVRYSYIHDNIDSCDGVGTNTAGIYIDQSQGSIIEYNWLKANYCNNPRGNNSANVAFASDYYDDLNPWGTNGNTFDPDEATHSNIIRYNLMDDTGKGFRHKNQQRFGYNDRQPDGAGLYVYKTYGDDIHHNIILNSQSVAISTNQDFAQVHHNIVDSRIDTGQNGDTPIVYNAVYYNNTVQTSGNCLLEGAGVTTSGTTKDNYYDSGSDKIVHPHVWIYNNICEGSTSAYHQMPFILAWDMPENETLNYSDDWSDLVVDRNLVHDSTASEVALIGHKWDGYTGCDDQDITISELNSCQDTWRSVSGTDNWENSTANLWVGGSGADQYIAVSTFVVDIGITIADGGIGGSHPYLPGAAISSYVGATDPNDNGWVAGVLAMDAAWFTSQTAGSDPSWIEGAASSIGGGATISGGTIQ